jgi:hypothetical protein
MKKNWSELGTFGLVFGRDFNGLIWIAIIVRSDEEVDFPL